MQFFCSFMDFDFKETFLSPAIIFDFKIVVACVKMLIIFADCRASHRQHCLVTSNVCSKLFKNRNSTCKSYIWQKYLYSLVLLKIFLERQGAMMHDKWLHAQMWQWVLLADITYLCRLVIHYCIVLEVKLLSDITKQRRTHFQMLII